ncbi:MAG: Rrf2 family transcriptional regulator, partial [Armatimonadota bacterium]
MELIKRNTGYGLRALLHMCSRESDEAATAEELAEAADTTVDFMHKIMRSLRERGIVTSKPGPGGGFRLARTPDEIDLLEIVVAVQGAFEVNR